MKKKLISVLLAALMLLSCFSVGLVAFAQEAQQADVVAAAEAVEATEQTDETVKMLQTYIALSEQENEMTKAQREKFNAAKDFFNDSVNTLSSEETVAKMKKLLSDVTYTAITALKGGAIGAFEADVNAYEGKLNTVTPSEEDLAGYNALVTAYNKLTDAQKGEIEILTFDKFFHLVLDREYYVERAKYEKPNTKTCYIAAQKNAVALLGNTSYIACFDEAAALFTNINDSKLSAQDKIDAFGAASANARAYAAVYYKNYGIMYNKMSASYIKNAVQTIMQAYGKEADKADPFTEKSPSKVTKPNDKNYAGGKQDPQYVADFAAYMNNQMLIAEYNSRKANHTTNHELEGLNKIASVAPEYAPIAKLIKDSMAAVDAFEESTANLAPAKKVVADFEKLTAYQQKFITDGGLKVRTVPNPSATSVGTTTKTTNTIYQQCTDIAQYDKFTAFIAVMDSIQEPYTREDITRAKEAYNEIPTSLHANVPEDVLAKYKAVMASIAPDVPSLDEPDLAIFKKTVVPYPENATKEQVATALPRIQNLLCDVVLPLLGMDGGLESTVKNSIYTNATVAKLCAFLFPTLAGLANLDGFPSIATGLVKIKPEALAKKLNEPEDAGKFAGAISALNASQVSGETEYNNWVAAGNEKDDVQLYTFYWTGLTAENGDWGFRDGDREGFLDAVSAVFRGVSIITMLLTFENDINTTNGTYSYNAYEDLVPIFEVLDLEGHMSSHEYTLYVNEIKAQNSNLAMDARVRPILVPIFNLIDEFAAAPLDTLLDVLPKLGWALKSNLINTQVSALISKLGFGLGDSLKLDLSTEGIYDLVAPMLKNITVKEASVDENTGDKIPAVTVSIHLDKEKFVQFVNDIGGCGTAAVKNSKARGTAYRLGIDSDKPDAFVVLFRWLYGEITSTKNVRSIKTIIDTMDTNALVKLLVKTVVNCISETPTEDALVMLVNLAAPKAPEIKIPDNLLPNNKNDANKDNKNDANKDEKNDANKNEPTQPGKTETGNPSIPKTGGSVMTACFSLVATAALAGGALLLKKKNKE